MRNPGAPTLGRSTIPAGFWQVLPFIKLARPGGSRKRDCAIGTDLRFNEASDYLTLKPVIFKTAPMLGARC